MANSRQNQPLPIASSGNALNRTSKQISGVPAFVYKLWTMLNSEEGENIIVWSKSGETFLIVDQSKLSAEVLPHFFKHNMVSSFIRQLNMYGFTKLQTAERSGLDNVQSGDATLEYYHPSFQMDFPELLVNVRRKTQPANKGSGSMKFETSDVSGLNVGDLLVAMQKMCKRQETLEKELGMVRDVNSTLWNEMGHLRSRHSEQQGIVRKLIGFLAGVLGTQRTYPMSSNSGGSSSGGAQKRGLQMIELPPDLTVPSEEPTKKKPKRQISVHQGATRSSPFTIKDITDAPDDLLLDINQTPLSNPEVPTVESLGDIYNNNHQQESESSGFSYGDHDFQLNTPQLSRIETNNNSIVPSEAFPGQYQDFLNDLDTNLSAVREGLASGKTIHIEDDFLQDLFNPERILSQPAQVGELSPGHRLSASEQEDILGELMKESKSSQHLEFSDSNAAHSIVSPDEQILDDLIKNIN